jgi:hypothetical protein
MAWSAVFSSQNEVIASDGSVMSGVDAVMLWEAGDFSSWAEEHGLPLTIDGTTTADWDVIEELLSEYNDDAEAEEAERYQEQLAS